MKSRAVKRCGLGHCPYCHIKDVYSNTCMYNTINPVVMSNLCIKFPLGCPFEGTPGKTEPEPSPDDGTIEQLMHLLDT